MREISEATLAILKSQNLTGQNRFSHSLKLEGTQYYTDIKQTTSNNVSSGTTGDFCVRADGKILYVYKIGQEIFLKVLDKEVDLMSIANIGSGGTLFYTVNSPEPINTENYTSVRICRLKSGKILLIINEYGVSGGGNFKNLVFRSDDGLGDNFNLISTLNEQIINLGRWEATYNSTDISKPVQDVQGHIYCRVPYLSTDLNALRTGFKIMKSVDDGLNWTQLFNWSSGFAVMTRLRFKGLVCYEYNNLKYLVNIYSYENMSDPTIFINFSADGGLTWTSFDSENIELFFYYMVNDRDYIFACGNYAVYRITKDKATTLSSLTNISNWEKVIDYSARTASGLMVTPIGNIHVIGDTNLIYPDTVTDLTMIRDEYSEALNVSSISISKGKGGSNTATIQASNKDGALNPKNLDGPLYNILGTNKQIIIKQGYGEEMVETFTGMIDEFEMSTWPQTMNIALRDNLKKALDQTITNGNQHTVDFASQPIENIVGYLCYLADIEVGTDAIEPTGISVAMSFSWCSYADAFQQLGDLASFEWGCDSYGKFYFRRDYQPNNMFVAYTFEEGIDLATLKYKISDKDLYSKVVVFGKSGDTVISYEAPFLDAALYNILPQKILKIDATEANTVGALQKIAERALSMMQSRTAVTNFTSIAIPWLEVGDFIGIYERSTGASSIYRLSDLSFNMDKDSFTMSGTAYYYGDSIVPGELPTDTATQIVAPTTNLIPEMTSNTAPSGVARASSIYTSNYEPWQAFNSHSNDYYWNSITNTGWIEYQFPEKTIVDKYMLKARQLTIYNDAMPRDWTFEGFDGEKWVILDRQTGQTNWGVYQSRTYLFINTTAYSKYRLNVSRNDGYMRLQLEQLAMYYGGGA